jgi:LysR substrate binding domain
MRHASRIAVLAGGEPWGTSGHVTTPTCARGATTTTPRGPSATARVPVRVERTYGGSGHRATKGDDVLYRDLHLARAECRPARIWAFDSYEAVKRAVADGAGVSFVSRLLVREEIGRGELAPFRIAGVERMVRPIHVVQPSLTELTPASCRVPVAPDRRAEQRRWQCPRRLARTSPRQRIVKGMKKRQNRCSGVRGRDAIPKHEVAKGALAGPSALAPVSRGEGDQQLVAGTLLRRSRRETLDLGLEHCGPAPRRDEFLKQRLQHRTQELLQLGGCFHWPNGTQAVGGGLWVRNLGRSRQMADFSPALLEHTHEGTLRNRRRDAGRSARELSALDHPFHRLARNPEGFRGHAEVNVIIHLVARRRDLQL